MEWIILGIPVVILILVIAKGFSSPKGESKRLFRHGYGGRLLVR